MSIVNINVQASSLPNQRLLGKVELVIGGASGIGETIVRLLHPHGAKVCIVDVQDNLGMRICESLEVTQIMFAFSFVLCDVTKEDEVQSSIDFTVSKFGTLNIIVNNAAIYGKPYQDIRHLDSSKFKKVFNINMKGVFHGMKRDASIMIPLKKGSIISISSVASTTGGLTPHAYTASKHAVWGLTKNVAAELGKHGIRVHCVGPYGVPTGLSLAYLPQEERTTEDAIASFRASMGRNANLQGMEWTANDVANAVRFLASDDARNVSGQNLMVDSGFTSVNHSLRVFR